MEVDKVADEVTDMEVDKVDMKIPFISQHEVRSGAIGRRQDQPLYP